MLCRKIMEGQQLFAVSDQAFGGLWVFRIAGLDEEIECLMRVVAGFGLTDVVQGLPRLGL